MAARRASRGTVTAFRRETKLPCHAARTAPRRRHGRLLVNAASRRGFRKAKAGEGLPPADACGLSVRGAHTGLRPTSTTAPNPDERRPGEAGRLSSSVAAGSSRLGVHGFTRLLEADVPRRHGPGREARPHATASPTRTMLEEWQPGR